MKTLRGEAVRVPLSTVLLWGFQQTMHRGVWDVKRSAWCWQRYQLESYLRNLHALLLNPYTVFRPRNFFETSNIRY